MKSALQFQKFSFVQVFFFNESMVRFSFKYAVCYQHRLNPYSSCRLAELQGYPTYLGAPRAGGAPTSLHHCSTTLPSPHIPWQEVGFGSGFNQEFLQWVSVSLTCLAFPRICHLGLSPAVSGRLGREIYSYLRMHSTESGLH